MTTKGSSLGGREVGAVASVVMAEKRARGRREKGAVPRSSTHSGRCNGVQSPATVARRLREIASLPWPERAVVRRSHPTAWGLSEIVGTPGDLEGVVAYLDPPYVGCTPYAVDCPRSVVLDHARDLVALGALVAISEAVSLAEDLGPSWSAVDLTLAPGRKPEWLTTSRAAAVRPAQQLELGPAAWRAE